MEAAPGSSYALMTTVLTTAMHGEKFRYRPHRAMMRAKSASQGDDVTWGGGDAPALEGVSAAAPACRAPLSPSR